jgi:hypothetical protein
VGEAGGQWKLIGMIAGVGVILLVVWLANRWAKQALKQELGQ